MSTTQGIKTILEMKKIINIIKWLLYFPLWVIMLSGIFAISLIEYVWVMIKKRKIAKKIIYSDLVQTWKEKVTGHPKIVIR